MAFYALNVHSEGDRRTLATKRPFSASSCGRGTVLPWDDKDHPSSDRRTGAVLSLSLSLSFSFLSLSSSTGVGEPARDASETKILVDIFLPDARRVDRMIANVRILICCGCNSGPFCRVRPEEYLLPEFL